MPFFRRTRRKSASLLALLGLLTACPDKPSGGHGGDGGDGGGEETPAPVTEVAVGEGQILAGDFQPTTLTWWIVNAATGDIISSGTQGAGAITFTLTNAAGAYVTTPSYTADPGYTIQINGSVAAGGLFSYLDTDVAAFTDLRANDGAAMAAKHAAMVTQAATLVSTFQTDLDTAKAQMANLAYAEVMRARGHMLDGANLLVDSDDLSTIDAGAAPVAPWVDGITAASLTLQAESDADVAIAEGNALSLSSYTPAEADLQSSIEDCFDMTAWADKIDQSLGKYAPKAIADESWEYDGRAKSDSGEIDDREYVTIEANIASLADDLEAAAPDVEQCVLDAIGGEPVLAYDDITPDPYIALGDAQTATAEALETAVTDWDTAVSTDYADYIELDSQTGDLTPATWAAAHTHALTTLTAMVGADLVADEDEPLTAESDDEVMAIENSSFTACEVPTGSFQINLAGLAVAIGTPFDDVIRGADVDNGFEVIVGLWGDDCLNGLQGHELILGGKGDDELHGGDQHELIFGGSGDDTIYTGEGASYDIDLPTTPPSTLTIDIGSVAFGGGGDDYVSGADPEFDEEDEDAFGYTDVLFGDFVSSEHAGDDELEGGAGIDLLFGQWGDDSLRNRRPGHFVIDTPETPDNPATTQSIEFGSLHFGGKGSDTIVASSSFDLIFGGKDDDTASGEEGIDLVFGGKGDDDLDGGDSLDLVFAGQGSDIARGGDGIDLVLGSSGADMIYGDGGVADLLFGGSDDDQVWGGDGIDLAFGNSGRDWVYGDAGVDLLFGNSDSDSVYGGDSIDLAFGNDGRDDVEGGAGLDLLFGNAETDILRGNDGVDVMFGNDGDDWMDGEAGVDLAWANGDDDAIFGGTEVDVLFGSEGQDCIWGEDGVDLAFGNEGDDAIWGGNQLDLLMGNDGADSLYGESGPDLITGNDGDDAISSGDDVDLVWAGAGADLVYGGASLDLVFGGAEIDCIDGEDGFDVSFGGDADDTLLDAAIAFGNDGSDALEASLGGFGGSGEDDAMSSGSGVAFLLGGDDNDHLYIASGADTAVALGNGGDDILSATGATAVGSTEVRSYLFGGKGNDWMQASKGRTVGFGQDGDDVMSGDADGTSTNDDIRDWLFGNHDVDLLVGDHSDKKDLLFRGAGNDPAKEWDSLPSSVSGWSSAHGSPNLGTCDAMPATDCDDQKEPPLHVGAKG